MEIAAEKIEGNITLIKLTGRLDMQGSQAVETRLAGHMAIDNGQVVVDVSNVSFLASIGIRAILLSAKALQKRGGKIALLNPIAEVAKVLSLSGIDTLIPVCSDIEAAKSAVAL